jgi:hypothetical protein
MNPLPVLDDNVLIDSGRATTSARPVCRPASAGPAAPCRANTVRAIDAPTNSCGKSRHWPAGRPCSY